MTANHPIDFTHYDLATPLIHIGFPKSLSTWLQRVLFQPENGFYTLMDPIKVQLDILDNNNFSFSLEDLNKKLEKYIGEIDDKSLTPVISSESLAGNMHSGGYNGFENAVRLGQIFPQAKFVIIVREQRSMIRSLYSESVKWGMPHSIKRYLNIAMPRLIPQFDENFLNYHHMVQYYQHSFGQENVLTLPYEMFKAEPDEFVRRIFQHAGAPADRKLEQQKVNSIQNPRHTASNILLQRVINRTLVATPWNYNGLKQDNEKLSFKRQRRMRIRNLRIPTVIDQWLERKIISEINNFAGNRFSTSNQELKKLTNIDFAHYGYDV